MIDWAGHFRGDCFDYVMARYGVNYDKALYMVALDFNLIDQGQPVERQPVAQQVIVHDTVPCTIKIERRRWNTYDAAYWRQYGIDRKTLGFFNVVPVQRVWVNGHLKFNYHYMENRVYAYDFGNGDWKVYFTYRKKQRFIQNNGSVLQGYAQLPQQGYVLVITKSYKDVIKLSQYGIASLAPMSESQVVQGKPLADLKERFIKTFALYDNDRTGKSALLEYRKLGVEPLLFPKGMPKDFTDYYKKYGDGKTRELIENIKNIYSL